MDITTWKETEERIQEEQKRRAAAEEMVKRQKNELFVSQLIMEAQALHGLAGDGGGFYR